MNKQEFIASLKRELRKLPEEEIMAATEYFNEYIDEVLDGGEQTEEEIIKGLGNPKRVAAQIKADYASRILDEDEMTVRGDNEPKKLSAIWWIILGACSVPVSLPIAICGALLAFGVILFAIGIMIGIYGMIVCVAATAVMAIGLGVVSISSSIATAIMLIGMGLVLAAISVVASVGAYIGTKALVKAVIHKVRKVYESKRREHNQGV